MNRVRRLRTNSVVGWKNRPNQDRFVQENTFTLYKTVLFPAKLPLIHSFRKNQSKPYGSNILKNLSIFIYVRKSGDLGMSIAV